MKNLKTVSALVLLFSLLTLGLSYASEPVYKVTTQNLKFTSANSLEFDIYVQSVGSGDTKINYILGQYFIDFNDKIANGGTLTYSIAGSDLPQVFLPRNPKVNGNQLWLATNGIPPKENLPVISSEAPGTKIVTMKLETSAKKFADVSPDLKFRMPPASPTTRVCSFENNKISEVVSNETGVATDNSTTGLMPNSVIPKEFALLQNYPNPFNPSTSIKFDVPVSSNVQLAVYDMTGRELALLVNEKLEPGSYDFSWNASQFASGIYFYRLKTDSYVHTKKMVLIK